MNERLNDRTTNTDSRAVAEIPRLISELASGEFRKCQRARETLTAIGKPAVAPLTQALESPNHFVRWEAAKALSEIRDPAAAPALVKALEDERMGIRWLAAEGLISLREEGLVPLLGALLDWSRAVWLPEGAHHILHHLATIGWGNLLGPVVNALRGIDPSLAVPVAAHHALTRIRDAGGATGVTDAIQKP